MLRAFWNRVYLVGSPAVSFPGGEAGSTAAATQLATLFSQRLETDRQVLAAAFANPAPLDEPPLLLLTADALSSLHERLRTSAPLYDFACRIKGSCPESDDNEATKLLRLIGAIGNDAALEQALATSTSVRTPWREVFTALRAQRQALESAYRKASGRSDASLEELYAPNLVASAAGLEELVSSSAAMWASYQSHGVLIPRDGSLLRASMAESARTGTVGLFSGSLSDLTLARDSYQKTRGDFANTVLASINNQQYQDRIRNEAVVLNHDYDRLASDLSGLMASQDHAEWLIGRFLAAYTERARAPDWLPNYPVSGTPHTIAVNAGDGRGDGSVIGSAAQVVAVAVRDPLESAQPWQLEVAKGDMLTFNVSGAWAPSCALRLTSILGPGGRTKFVDPIDATTGPEGYAISWENGKFRAREHSSSNFSTTSATSTICGSLNAALGSEQSPDRPDADVFSVALSGSYCCSWQTGHTETDTTSSGNRFNVGASFAGGLRIPGTPFPTLPGGSLLLVEVRTGGDGEQVTDVHVVRSQSTVLFRNASKVYLVVNDTSCSPFNPSQLAVTYVHAQSAGPASQLLAQTMATVLSSLDTEKDRYVAQGSVTASELSALQTSAYDQLLAACDGCSLSAYPEQVRGMFDAWLSAKLASIERQTRIASAQRDLDRLVLRANALQSDIAGAEGSSRLLALMTSWQLGHLAFHQLREKTSLVLENGNDYMLPLLHVRYPQALTVLRTSSVGVINDLRNVDWILPFDEQLQRLEALGRAVATRVDQATLIGGQASASLIVAFPKPLPAGTTTARPSIPGAVVASPDRASAVWEPCASGYCLKQRPVFTIDPADVYGQPSIGLGCGEAAPIVRSLAVFAVNTVTSHNEIWNSTPRRFDNVRASDIGFPTETGIRSYRVGPPLGALTGARVRSLVGTVSEVWPSFTTFARADRDFDGTSPFGSFEVNFGTFATDSTGPISSAHTMAVVMEVETRAAIGRLLGVSSCRGAQ